MSKERLQKALSRAGVASRRHVESMVLAGRVYVNGKKVTELGHHIDIDNDRVTVDAQEIRMVSGDDQEKVYFLLYKPAGVLTAVRDESGRKTVMDYVVGASEGRIYPVGRLDYDAEGALFLTNDGELANRLIHPKFHVPKRYMVKIKGIPVPSELDKLRRGVYLEDGPTGPSQIEVLGKAKTNTWVEVVLTQGKNRQIKRMFWRIKRPVQKLIRTHFAGISIEGLNPGGYRSLNKREVERLRSQVM